MSSQLYYNLMELTQLSIGNNNRYTYVAQYTCTYLLLELSVENKFFNK